MAQTEMENKEAQRLLLMARNGRAAICFLRQNFKDAANVYRGSLTLAADNMRKLAESAAISNKNPPPSNTNDTGIDPLQELHILHNLADAQSRMFTMAAAASTASTETTTMTTSSSSSSTASTSQPYTQNHLLGQLHVHKLQSRAKRLERRYSMVRQISVEVALRPVTEFRKSLQKELEAASGCWQSALAKIKTFDDDKGSSSSLSSGPLRSSTVASSSSSSSVSSASNRFSGGQLFHSLVGRCHAMMANYPMGVVNASAFVKPAALSARLHRDFSDLLEVRERLVETLTTAGQNPTPADSDVKAKGNCGTCAKHLGGKGPPCSHCQMEQLLKQYTRNLFCETGGQHLRRQGRFDDATAYVRRPAPLFSIASATFDVARSVNGSRGSTNEEAANLVSLQNHWNKLYSTLKKEHDALREVRVYITCVA